MDKAMENKLLVLFLFVFYALLVGKAFGEEIQKTLHDELKESDGKALFLEANIAISDGRYNDAYVMHRKYRGCLPVFSKVPCTAGRSAPALGHNTINIKRADIAKKKVKAILTIY